MNDRRTRWPLVMGAATFLGSTFAAVPSFAQDRVIEEILVTARKREEVLTDVPASITVLNAAQLERAGVERAADFIKLVPGMSLVNAAEVADTQVNIRGINGARDAENSFAFILDGILMTNPAAFNREYINLEQIEVLKGPQGALYGRNAAAGAVIVSTQKPDDTMRFKFKGSAAEDSTYSVVASAMGPIVEGSTYFSISGDYRDTDGFHSNSFTGDDSVDNFESWNINGRLLFEPSDNLSLDFKARYGEVDAASITFNASFALPVVAEIFSDPNFYEDSNDHDFEFQGNIEPQNDQDSTELSAKLDYDADWGTITAWSLYSNIENSLSADGTSGAFGFFNNEPTCRQTTADEFAAGTTLPSPQILAGVPEFSVFGPYTPVSCDGTQYQERNQEDYSFEVRVASPDDQQLRWLGGAYYLHIDREVGVNLGIDQGFGVTESLFVPQNGLNPTEQLLWDDFETDVYAVFGQLEYDISDTVEIAAALRYDREERDASSKVPVNATTQYVLGGGAPINPALFGAATTIPDVDDEWDQWEPKVTITWDAVESTTLFASWGVGFKSGGFNNQGSQATVETFFNSPPPIGIGTDLVIEDQYDEETSNAFEIGFKSTFSDRFFLDGAIFYTKVDDMQFFEFLVGPFGLLRVVSNIDEVEIAGFELGANTIVTDWLQVYGGFSYVDSEIEENNSRPATEGNESPYTPEFTFNLASEVDFPITGNLDFVGGAYVTWVGDTWFHTVQDNSQTTLFENSLAFVGVPGIGTANYDRTRRDDYVTLDLRAGVAGDGWEVTVFGNNVTDEDHLEENITAPEFGGSFIHPGAESRWGLQLIVEL